MLRSIIVLHENSFNLCPHHSPSKNKRTFLFLQALVAIYTMEVEVVMRSKNYQESKFPNDSKMITLTEQIICNHHT